MSLVLVAIATLLPLCNAAGMYITGLGPTSYEEGSLVEVKVNALSSHQAVMPFPFYDFKACSPSTADLALYRTRENIGELLWGDQIEISLFEVRMRKNVTCRSVCTAQYTPAEIVKNAKFIDQFYRGNLILDNLPAAQSIKNAGPRSPKILQGYPLGVPSSIAEGKKALVNNHLRLTIGYHEPEEMNEESREVFRVVEFNVTAMSVAHAPSACQEGKIFPPPQVEPVEVASGSITFSYSVEWVDRPDKPWATRFDIYLMGGEHDDKIHWYSIINSLLILLFLSAMVAVILLRALRKDVALYNAEDAQRDGMDEFGWKMVHGDVFRAPEHAAFLGALVGSGCQVLAMAMVVLGIACLGFLAPTNRGSLLTTMIFFFVVLGSYAGFVSARLFKFWHVQSWKNSFLAASLLPASTILIYAMINFVQWYKHASSAVRWTTFMMLMALWFGVSLPLSLVGSAVAYRRPVLEAPCRVNPLPRLIPSSGRWWLQPKIAIPAAGVLPFGAAFIELVFILASFWQGRVYYVFGFLALVVLIVVVTCAETVVVCIYFQLCDEDHRWWWRSFLLSASSGACTFLYSVYYLASTLTIRQPSSIMLYLGYMSLASSMFAIAAGAVGFLSASWFVWTIYGAIKIE